MNPEELKSEVRRYQDPQLNSETQRPGMFGKESFIAHVFRVQMRKDYDSG